MIDANTLILAFKIVLFTSLFFVWVVRYENIQKEFKEYNLPNWLRDFVGIVKLSFATMILIGDNQLVRLGSFGIALLMTAALFTHFRMKNSPARMIPSLSLLIISIVMLRLH